MKKHYMNIRIRLRQDSGAKEPEYTKEEVMTKLKSGTAVLHHGEKNSTIFVIDRLMSNKIMGVVEDVTENSSGKMSEEEFISSAREHAATLNRPIEDQDIVDVFGVDYDEARRVVGILKLDSSKKTITDFGTRRKFSKKNIMEKAIVHSTVYLMIDSQGNKTGAIVEDPSDTVQVCGMHDQNGESLDFESDAYHIHSWCKDNGIELKVIKREEDFDSLWEAAE